MTCRPIERTGGQSGSLKQDMVSPNAGTKTFARWSTSTKPLAVCKIYESIFTGIRQACLVGVRYMFFFIEVSFLGSSLQMINIARVRVYGILLGFVHDSASVSQAVAWSKRVSRV